MRVFLEPIPAVSSAGSWMQAGGGHTGKLTARTGMELRSYFRPPSKTLTTACYWFVHTVKTKSSRIVVSPVKQRSDGSCDWSEAGLKQGERSRRSAVTIIPVMVVNVKDPWRLLDWSVWPDQYWLDCATCCHAFIMTAAACCSCCIYYKDMCCLKTNITHLSLKDCS